MSPQVDMFQHKRTAAFSPTDALCFKDNACFLSQSVFFPTTGREVGTAWNKNEKYNYEAMCSSGSARYPR